MRFYAEVEVDGVFDDARFDALANVLADAGLADADLGGSLATGVVRAGAWVDVEVHDEPGEGLLWAEVAGLPGVYATGHDEAELRAGLTEAIGLVLADSALLRGLEGT